MEDLTTFEKEWIALTCDPAGITKLKESTTSVCYVVTNRVANRSALVLTSYNNKVYIGYSWGSITDSVPVPLTEAAEIAAKFVGIEITNV